jgi:hypothetical protein
MVVVNEPERGAESYLLTCRRFQELVADVVAGPTELMPLGFSEVQIRVTERFRTFCPSSALACDAVTHRDECVYCDKSGEPKLFESEAHCITNLVTKDLRRANYRRHERLETGALPPRTWTSLPEEHPRDDGAPPAPAAVESDQAGHDEFARLQAPAQVVELIEAKLLELDTLTITPTDEHARAVLEALLQCARDTLTLELPGGRNEFVDSLMAEVSDRYVGDDGAVRQRRRRLRAKVRGLAARIQLDALVDHWVPLEENMGRHEP